MSIYKEKYEERLNNWLLEKKEYIKEQSYIKYYTVIKKNIIPMLGKYRINKITRDVLDTYFQSNEFNNLSLSIQNTIYFIIKSSINSKKIVFEKYNIKKPKCRINYLTNKEEKILIDYIINNMNINNLEILICLYTGIRIGEICSLKWKDIDFINNTISIKRTSQRIRNINSNTSKKTKIIVTTPKSISSIRTIPVGTSILNYLKEYYIDKDCYILTSSNKPKDTRVYEKYFERVLIKWNLKKINFHSLRHTFATRCAESGIDVKSLSEILGHSNYSVTLNIYVHSSIYQKRRSIDKIIEYVNDI